MLVTKGKYVGFCEYRRSCLQQTTSGDKKTRPKKHKACLSPVYVRYCPLWADTPYERHTGMILINKDKSVAFGAFVSFGRRVPTSGCANISHESHRSASQVRHRLSPTLLEHSRHRASSCGSSRNASHACRCFFPREWLC